MFISNILLAFCLNLASFFGAASSNTTIIGYDLSKPDNIFPLPGVLHEISGLTNVDASTIACVQDENGIVFIYDIINNQVKEQYNFHIDGDYEGIALVNRSMFILRSDGVLFEMPDYGSADSKLRTHVTGIPAKNNEGLCYDSDNNRLLIACKSKTGKGPEHKDKRVIYGFDLSSKKLSDEPAYSFDIPAILAFAKEKKVNLHVSDNNVTDPVIRFLPSAIAIHPLSKKLYLLSAADHLLFIFGTNGALEYISPLDPQLFNKAEGITFSGDGDLFVSNEGQDRKPTMLRFNYSAR